MSRKHRERDPSASTPLQEDEAEVLSEIGAAPADDGSGGLVADEAKVLEAGAVDTASIRENRRVDAMVGKQRAGIKGVEINVENICDKYDIVLRTWPANSLTVTVKRRTGGMPVEWRIESRPKTGGELYAAIRTLHGPNDEATYDVKFTEGGQFRGQGTITMPDARLPSPPQGPTMQPPYQQPAPQQAPVVQVTAPTTDPVAMMQQMFQMFQQMQASLQQHPQAQPAPQQPQPAMPVGQPTTDPMAMMQQMFQLFQQMQGSVQQPQPQPPLSAQQPPPLGVQGAPPTDPMAMMQQMFQMFQQMQGPQRPAYRGAQPQPQPIAPTAQIVPQAAAVDPMAMMQQMFQFFQQMQASIVQTMGGSGPGPVGGGPPYRGPYSGPRPPSYGGGPPGGPTQQPAQPRSAAQEFRDAVSVVRTVAQAAEEIRSILPSQQQPAAEPSEPEEDSPVKVMDVGDYKLVLGREDGRARLWETGWANMGPVLKWVGEQREAIQKANERKPPPQQLPPGYVEVGPGYVPPPGFVAIPVEQLPPQQQQQLPQPPAQMPPPIEEEPTQRRQWGPPPIPGRGN